MATVITNLISAIPFIGKDIVEWVWGGFSVNNATLNRFFSFHYLFPFVLAALAVVHIIALHEHGSNNPLGVDSNIDKVPFHPYYTVKDLFGYAIFTIFFAFFVFFAPNVLGHGWPFNQIFFNDLKYLINAMCYMLETYENHNNTYIISDSFFFYANPDIVKIYYDICNQQITNINCLWLVGISETIRTQKILFNSYSFLHINSIRIYIHLYKRYFTTNFLKIKKDQKFNEWLAGLIDGDGYFGLVDNKYPVCEITVGIEDEKMLYQIQNKFGGSIKKRSGVNAVRYRLSKREDMINLVNSVNGNIRNSKRIVQFYRICDIFNIEVLPAKKLTINNAWISGFFDADGTINYYHYANNRPQLFISITNKFRHDIEDILDIFGGNIYFDKKGYGCFKWVITNEETHMKYYEYNKLCPSRSFKGQRLFLLKNFYKLYNLKAYLKNENNKLLYKAWVEFDIKWQKRIK